MIIQQGIFWIHGVIAPVHFVPQNNAHDCTKNDDRRLFEKKVDCLSVNPYAGS